NLEAVGYAVQVGGANRPAQEGSEDQNNLPDRSGGNRGRQRLPARLGGKSSDHAGNRSDAGRFGGNERRQQKPWTAAAARHSRTRLRRNQRTELGACRLRGLGEPKNRRRHRRKEPAQDKATTPRLKPYRDARNGCVRVAEPRPPSQRLHGGL